MDVGFFITFVLKQMFSYYNIIKLPNLIIPILLTYVLELIAQRLKCVFVITEFKNDLACFLMDDRELITVEH